MDFTQEQIVKLAALADAMDGTAMIGDLPTLTPGTGDIIMEGTGPDGQSGKFGLFSIIKSRDMKIAARRWNQTQATPIGEAWGNIDLLRNLPAELGLGCYLTTDDRISKKLDPTNHYKFADGTPAALDGSLGQYMWCWRDMYYAWWVEGDYFYEGVSFNPIEKKNGECYRIPAGGTSALGNGVVDRTNLILCSLISDDPQYRGGNNNVAYDGTYRTFLGKPATSIAMTNFSVYARKRGEGWESQWYVSRAVQEYLFRIIMGTRNSQTALNPEKDANGLYQGGLGPGFTDVPSADWNTYNGYYPLVPTSAGVELGDSVGVAEYDIPNEDGSVFRNAKIPVFFGLKNLYGNLWTGVRGLITDAGPEISSVYVAPSLYANYANDSVEGMIKAAETYRTESYIKKLSMNKLCCMPTEGGASSSTFYCDYHYVNHNTSQGLRGRLAGSSASFGANAGAFVSGSAYAVAYSSSSFSAALCFFEEDPVMQ
jgi:hypothetical protein